MTNSYSIRILAWLGLISATGLATAQSNDPVELSPLFVSASRLNREAENASADRIDPGALSRFASPGILDALQNTSSAWVSQPGGEGGFESLFVRGSDPNLAQIRVDGIPINDATDSRGGSANFGLVDPEFLSVAVLMPGSASAVYGSSALSGVLNVQTEAWGGESRTFAHVGEQGYFHSGGMMAGRLNTADSFGFVGASYLDSGDSSPGASSRVTRASAGIDWLMTERIRLELRVHASDRDSERFPDDSGGPEFAVIRDLEKESSQDRLLSLKAILPFNGSGTIHVLAGAYERDALQLSPGVAPGIRDPQGLPASSYDSALRTYTLQLYAEQELGSGTRILIGGEYLSEEGSSASELDFGFFDLHGTYRIDRFTTALFSEVEQDLPHGFELSARLRGNFFGVDTKVEETVWSPGLALGWNRSRSGAQLSWGKGFKLPSFFALGNPVVGNPMLQSEEGDSLELNLQQGFLDNRLIIGAAGFRNDFDQLVDFDPGPPPQLVNRREVAIRGLEVKAFAWAYTALSMEASFAILDVESPGSGDRLYEIPERYGCVNLRYRFDLLPCDLYLRMNYTGERLATSIPTGDRELEASLTLDASMRWTPRESIDVQVSVLDILGEQAEQAVGFRGPGRSLRGTLRFRF